MVHWAIALRLQKPSSRWTKDRSCTNIHTGPLKGGQPDTTVDPDNPIKYDRVFFEEA